MNKIGIISGIGMQATKYYQSILAPNTDVSYYNLNTKSIIDAINFNNFDHIKYEFLKASEYLKDCNVFGIACISLQEIGIKTIKSNTFNIKVIDIMDLFWDNTNDSEVYGILCSKYSKTINVFSRDNDVYLNDILQDKLDKEIYKIALNEPTDINNLLNEIQDYFKSKNVTKVVIGCTDLTWDEVLKYNWTFEIMNVPLLHITEIKRELK